jgi:hypothetical protein
MTKNKNENFLKLLMLNYERDEYFTVELKSSDTHPHSIKSYKMKLLNDTDPEQEVNRLYIINGDSNGLLESLLEEPID